MDLLHTFNLFEWPGRYPRPLFSAVDPLAALQFMTDFYTQVHEAADLIGQSIIVGVERFVDPHTCVPPITLSNTEHTRLVCTLWILRIYYQLRLKFSKHPPEYAVRFPDAFWRNLSPWQIDQGLSLEQRLARCHDDYDESLNHYDETESGLLERLIESRYVKRHISWFSEVMRFRGRSHGSHDMNVWMHQPSDVGHPSNCPSMSTRLRNHAWSCSDPSLHYVAAAHTDRYVNICRHLGLFFWDYTRLSHWRITEANELMAAADVYPGLSTVAVRYGKSSEGLSENQARSAAIERTKQRQIIEWTRCTRRYSLEEWLYHKTVVHKGGEFLPMEDIIPGVLCSDCGLDGHSKFQCRQASKRMQQILVHSRTSW